MLTESCLRSQISQDDTVFNALDLPTLELASVRLRKGRTLGQNHGLQGKRVPIQCSTLPVAGLSYQTDQRIPRHDNLLCSHSQHLTK